MLTPSLAYISIVKVMVILPRH